MIKIDYFCFTNPSRSLKIQDNVDAFNRTIAVGQNKGQGDSGSGLSSCPIFSPLTEKELRLVERDFRDPLKSFVSHFGDEVLPELWSRGGTVESEDEIVEREIRMGDLCLAKTPQGFLLRGYIKKVERRNKFAHIAFYEKCQIHLVQFNNLRYMTDSDESRMNLLKTISAEMTKWGIDAIKLDLSNPPRSRYVTFRKTKFADNSLKILDKENWRASRKDDYNLQNNPKIGRFNKFLGRSFPPAPPDPNVNLSLLRSLNIIEHRDPSPNTNPNLARNNGAWRDLRTSCESCYRKEKSEGVVNLKWSKKGLLCDGCLAQFEKDLKFESQG